MIDQARVHYAFIGAGVSSANVVQPSATLYYFLRAPKTSQVQAFMSAWSKSPGARQ